MFKALGLNNDRGWRLSEFNTLDDLSEPQLLVVYIKFDVVATHEHITENVQRTSWSWNVQSSEAKEALSLLVDHIVFFLQSVCLAADDELDIWACGIAINGVLLSTRERQPWRRPRQQWT